MKYLKAKTFRGKRAWDSELLGTVGDFTARVHWTDAPYRWHVNTGREVFFVIDGRVEMKYREEGAEQSVSLEAGDAMVFEEGEEHVAHPIGEARILVFERHDSE